MKRLIPFAAASAFIRNYHVNGANGLSLTHAFIEEFHEYFDERSARRLPTNQDLAIKEIYLNCVDL